jgi:hypothetical protein
MTLTLCIPGAAASVPNVYGGGEMLVTVLYVLNTKNTGQLGLVVALVMRVLAMASMSCVAQPPEIDEKGAKEFVISMDVSSMTMMTKEEDDYVRVVLTNKNRKETTFWWNVSGGRTAQRTVPRHLQHFGKYSAYQTAGKEHPRCIKS